MVRASIAVGHKGLSNMRLLLFIVFDRPISHCLKPVAAIKFCGFCKIAYGFLVCYLCAEITRTLVQKLKTRVVKKNCNPVWNEELTLSITDLNVPINLTVFDKDTFTVDDKMGEARIDIQPYIASLKMGLQNLPKGCVVSRVQPSQNNCLADESCIVWDDGKLLQDMNLRLRNVESGEVTIQIEWIDVPGCRGLKTEVVVVVEEATSDL
ncbi:hypothetical protein D5086_016582 [Populus alba]|uniref:Uncharacterized protein n=1 Tax=Populus alba TaxID=43335 RepID=A0ACC4BV15_POPAL